MDANQLKNTLGLLIEQMAQVSDDTERFGLENMQTGIWRIHAKQQELLKQLKILFEQEFNNEQVHEPM